MWVICISRKVSLDYFSKERCKVDLPDPRGPLSSKILPSTIAAANTEIIRVMNGSSELELKSTGEKRPVQQVYGRVQSKSTKLSRGPTLAEIMYKISKST